MSEEITDKINTLIKDKYGDYKPRGYRPFKRLHDAIRKGLNNDAKFIEFLEEQIKERPTYKPLIINNGKETNT